MEIAAADSVTGSKAEKQAQAQAGRVDGSDGRCGQMRMDTVARDDNEDASTIAKKADMMPPDYYI
jgi:hypothetical protein